MRNFRELEVWKDARKLVKEIYVLTEQLPETEKFGLTSQMQRCVVSITANIAEGCAKYSQKEFVRFLQIGLGSSYELETHLIICADLQFIRNTSSTQTIEKVQLLQRRLASLIKYYNK
ncbi:four helix bundle protein [Flagellimonas sp.]|uniref:four helix bundle protein n=1 Tax=Flagellimonas sp. TaxID=2058762 RepID=UPI003F49BD56